MKTHNLPRWGRLSRFAPLCVCISAILFILVSLSSCSDPIPSETEHVYPKHTLPSGSTVPGGTTCPIQDREGKAAVDTDTQSIEHAIQPSITPQQPPSDTATATENADIDVAQPEDYSKYRAEPSCDLSGRDFEAPGGAGPQFSSTQSVPVPFFVGNSLMEGMRLNSSDGYDFFCKVGISIGDLNRKLTLPAYYNIAIIEMGSNELGAYSEKNFKSGYTTLIDTLGCPCYCLSIPPCNETKSNYTARVNNENVKLYNSYIQDVCASTGATYIDCTEFFGESLQADWTRDGLHLTSSVYSQWYQWVLDKVGIRLKGESLP